MRAVLLCFLVAATFCGLAAADVACDAAANQARPPCADGETCCGAGTMTPSCIPYGSDKQCCRHFLSSTQCNATQSCCGMMGSGASSYAYCCDAGSTCCKSSGSGTGVSACCAEGSQCCNAPNGGYCCPAEKVCNLNMMSCDDAVPATTTTAAPAYSSQPAEVTTAAPPAANCLAWSSSSGATCTADEDCCGAGTMFPQCIAKDSGKQCCTWFKAATTCNATQSCCGMMGPGASSSAFCCNEGSTCCHASSSTSGTSTCCPEGSTCCAGSSIGLCCGADEVCNSGMNRCDKIAYGSQPAEVTTTPAPTPAPYSSQPAEVTTAAPTTAAPYAQPTTTAAPYSSQPAEVTTAAPNTAAPYTPPTTAAPAYTSSQPAEVTTQAPTTAVPYGSQPAEVTTESPGTYNPTPAPVWDTYSPAPGQASWTPVLVSFVAVLVLAVIFH